MKATPFFEQVMHLAAQFLRGNGYEELANQLEQKYPLPAWVKEANVLLKQGLIKVVKEYVRSNPKLCKYYHKRMEKVKEGICGLQRSEQNEDIETPSLNTNVVKKESPEGQKSPPIRSWISKFDKPKRLQDIIDNSEVQPGQESLKVVPKKSKKAQRESSSEYEPQQDYFELQPRKKTKRQTTVSKRTIKEYSKQKDQQMLKKIASKAAQYRKNAETDNKQTGKEQDKYNINGYKQSFSRINKDQIGPLADHLKDNSFYAKQKFGQGGDDWGQHGYEKLKDTRGDAFKKTKGKLKNKAFQGTIIDCNRINSVPIL